MLPSGLAPEQKARHWAEAISGQGEADVDCPRPHDFRARIDMMAFGGTVVSRSYASSIRLVRSKSHIAVDGKDAVTILVCDGPGELGGQQRGRENILRRGDAMIVSQAEINSTYALKGGHALVATVPRATLVALGADVDSWASRFIDRHSDALQLMRDYIRLLMTETGPLSAPVANAAAAHVAELAALAAGASVAERSPLDGGARAAARVALLIEAIGRRAPEPGLDAAIVGKPMNLSERSVQHLLHQAGTTFTGELREARLRLAEKMLVSRTDAGKSIIDVAHACGFADLSTFYRAFRARFGATPAEVRAQASQR